MVDTFSEGVTANSTMNEKAETIRKVMFTDREGGLKKGQLSQLHQLAGRDIELAYVCFAISNILNVDCDEDIRKTFEQKQIEQGEKNEIGFIGILREVLIQSYNEHHKNSAYITESNEIKISNKEIFDKFNVKLKEEVGHGVSPVTFKGYMIEFGFTDSLNRVKLKVPIPSDPEPKSRLCNIFTNRVLRKLGIDSKDLEKTELKKLENLKNWIKSECEMFTTSTLKKKIAELGFLDDPKKIIERLEEAGDLGPDKYIVELEGSE